MKKGIISFEEFVRQTLSALNAAGIDYMIGGAVAVWAWGEPRATMDLDLVVKIPLNAAGQLSKELDKQDMVVPEDIIRDNILEDKADLPISAIHTYSGYKADLYPQRDGDHLRASAFKRRQKIDLGEPLGEVYLHSPEDLIIYKLWFFSMGKQTKHIRDITGIVMTLGEELEYDYIDRWVTDMGLTSIWSELLEKIRKE